MVVASMLAMNVTRRVFAEMRVWRVGQAERGPEFVDGMYPYIEIPELVNISPIVSPETSSELTRRMVITSFGLVSSHVLISESHFSRVPPLRSKQLE